MPGRFSIEFAALAIAGKSGPDNVLLLVHLVVLRSLVDLSTPSRADYAPLIDLLYQLIGFQPMVLTVL